ncbi:hypothetical protein OC846_004113 [Tilletia horrida]|uniref:Uncharacterized protein n=1 Tax=Tilletia horrida TaxID=155126 RepID=A0AAN6GTJ0_9BASI|nr:hypothetical protein OC846_004113 [Tilletia horrida]KAK0564474.1 hypothetical protein OC861_004285 [Tilletia horrida]
MSIPSDLKAVFISYVEECTIGHPSLGSENIAMRLIGDEALPGDADRLAVRLGRVRALFDRLRNDLAAQGTEFSVAMLLDLAHASTPSGPESKPLHQGPSTSSRAATTRQSQRLRGRTASSNPDFARTPAGPATGPSPPFPPLLLPPPAPRRQTRSTSVPQQHLPAAQDHVPADNKQATALTEPKNSKKRARRSEDSAGHGKNAKKHRSGRSKKKKEKTTKMAPPRTMTQHRTCRHCARGGDGPWQTVFGKWHCIGCAERCTERARLGKFCSCEDEVDEEEDAPGPSSAPMTSPAASLARPHELSYSLSRKTETESAFGDDEDSADQDENDDDTVAALLSGDEEHLDNNNEEDDDDEGPTCHLCDRQEGLKPCPSGELLCAGCSHRGWTLAPDEGRKRTIKNRPDPNAQSVLVGVELLTSSRQT